MTASKLLDRFELIIDAPDTMPRLRRLIVDLAVGGRLVQKESNDEPASELLKRIQAKTTTVVTNAKHGSGANRPITDNEIPFPVSSDILFARLAAIAKIEKGNTGIQKARPGQYPLVTLAEERATSAEYQFDAAAAIVPLISSTGHGHASLKRMHYQEGKFALGNILCAVIPFAPDLVSARFLYEYLWAYKEPLLVEKMIGTANVSLTISKIGEAPIPIISPRSQERLHDLMVLCDRLEAAQAERESRRDKLIAASLHRLNNGADADESREHARFHLHHLPRLTTRPEHIQQLRQTILNLAVRGKLVPQDPNDEPASELLERIERTRAHLYTEKKIPKPKNLPSLESVQIPFEVGSGWEWTMLGRLCYQVSDGPHHSPKYVSSDTGVPFLSTRNVRPDRFDLGDLKYVSREDHERFCQRIRPEREDILYTKGGTTGIARVNDLDFEFSVWVHVAVLRIAKKFLVPRYVAMALNSPLCYEQSQAYTQGISNYDLGLTRMIKILMPLPPLAEQHRIVAKVEELMALCDRLEAQLTTTQTESRRLLEAVLHEALE